MTTKKVKTEEEIITNAINNSIKNVCALFMDIETINEETFSNLYNYVKTFYDWYVEKYVVPDEDIPEEIFNSKKIMSIALKNNEQKFFTICEENYTQNRHGKHIFDQYPMWLLVHDNEGKPFEQVVYSELLRIIKILRDRIAISYIRDTLEICREKLPHFDWLYEQNVGYVYGGFIRDIVANNGMTYEEILDYLHNGHDIDIRVYTRSFYNGPPSRSPQKLLESLLEDKNCYIEYTDCDYTLMCSRPYGQYFIWCEMENGMFIRYDLTLYNSSWTGYFNDFTVNSYSYNANYVERGLDINVDDIMNKVMCPVSVSTGNVRKTMKSLLRGKKLIQTHTLVDEERLRKMIQKCIKNIYEPDDPCRYKNNLCSKRCRCERSKMLYIFEFDRSKPTNMCNDKITDVTCEKIPVTREMFINDPFISQYL